MTEQINVCRCEYKDCPNVGNCKRIEAVGEFMDFKQICKGSNDFQWIIKIDKDIENCKSEEKPMIKSVVE